MKKLLAAAGCLLIAACSTTGDPADIASRASLAIQELEGRDVAAVDVCRQAVDGCDGRATDTAATDICDNLSAHCDGLDNDLGQVREPSVTCWRGAAQCDHDGGRDCEAQVSTCDKFDDKIDANRGPVIDCARIVEKCLADQAAAGQTGDVCTDVAAECDEVANLAADAEDARARGDERADDMCKDAHDAVPAGNYGENDNNGDFGQYGTDDGHPSFNGDAGDEGAMEQHPGFGDSEGDRPADDQGEIDSDMVMDESV